MSDGARSIQAIAPERATALADKLARVRQRIQEATSAAGRTDEPTLIVVTKFFPVEDLVALADAGVEDIGENREQELADKVAALESARPDLLERPRRHFIGQVQSKKAKRVAGLAHVVHSLDRIKLVPLFNAGAEQAGRELDILLQVDLEEASQGRGGARPQDLEALAEAVEQAEHLRLRGLMAVAPLGEEPARAFDRLGHVRAGFLRHSPDATMLSAGMSADLEEAVAIGATHLRVGSAILGSRPVPG